MGALHGVAATALGVARIRAAESARPDRLFDDPYAAAFVAAAEPPDADAEEADTEEAGARAEDSEEEARRGAFAAGLRHHVVVRTRFFDERLTAATVDGGLRQVVLLAAGLDARAYRLPWPEGVRLFEIDQPEVLDFKERVLGARDARAACVRTPVAADLRAEWAAPLRAAGFDPGRPTAWLVEGLLVYLSAEEAAALLTEVGRQSAPGSVLAFSGSHHFRSGTLMTHARRLPSLSGLVDMWRGGLDEDAVPWLGRHGWDARAHDRAAVAADYGRPGGRTSPTGRGRAFVTAVRGADA